MSAPYEVLAGPLTVYVAPVGTSFPAVNASPSGSWFKLGTNGTRNLDEKGVIVHHDQTLNPWTSAGSTGASKVFRSAESLMIEFDLVDLTPEQYAKVMNDATVTTAAGPPNIKSFNLKLGLTVATFALVARGTSPVNDALPSQYQVPIVYQAGNPQPAFVKGAPAGLSLQFAALDDAANGFGLRVDQIA